jgi:O-antigen ligase
VQNVTLSDWSAKNAEKIFWSIAAIALLSLTGALLSDVYLLAGIPFILVGGFLCLIRPDLLFYLLVFVLSFSMEFEFGGFGTDLPSEPLAILMAGVALMALITHPTPATKSMLKHPFTWVLILHITWVAVCIPFSTDSIVSFKYFLAKNWYVAGFFLGTWMIVTRPERMKMALGLLVSSTLVGVAYIMYEHALLGFTFESINTACNPLYRNHVTYGVFMAMILPILVTMRMETKTGSLIRLLCTGSILLLLAAIVLTYTRGAWLAVPAMIAAVFLLKYQLFRWAIPLSIVASVVFFYSMGKDFRYLQYAPDYENTIYHDDLNDHLSATFEGEDMSTMERFHRWIAAFRMMKDYPAVGVGPGNFVSIYKPYTVSDFETYISENEERSTVHNYFIFMMVEQGFPGLLVALLLMSVPLLYAERQFAKLKQEKYRIIYMALVAGGIAFWLNNLFSDLMEANKVAPLWLMSLALMIRISEWDKAESATEI